MYNPVATYRIQFHKDFTLADLERLIPYLQKLGVGTVYASPIFDAVPGSTHGYDGTNPHRINPEVGTEDQLKDISRQLQEKGMGWLQDIVPNHMAFHPKNEWLMDVLEKGLQSVYAPFFDIAWTSPLYKGRLMVPFLGGTLEEVISRDELKLAFENGRLVLKYYDSAYPVGPRSYATLLQAGTEKPNEAIRNLLDQMAPLHAVEDPVAYAYGWNEWLLQLGSLMKNKASKAYVDKHIQEVNSSKERLLQLADEQTYRLCHWQETDQHINYRRFFTVNGLICLNIQDKEVFDHYHRFIKKLLEEGVFQGLRIDHIDGLYDPHGYLNELRQMAGEETYVVVEKILEPHEDLPQNWPVQGNTGYDFLSIVNNLFTLKSSEKAFTLFYKQLVKDHATLQQQLHDKKAYILTQHMAGELDNLFRLFSELNLMEKKHLAHIHPDDIKTALAEFLIQCPVYRYYGNQFPLGDEEAAAVREILNRIRQSGEAPARAVAILEKVFLEKPEAWNKDYNQKVQHFYQRCMQFTGPLMAKGMEDTLMYTYNRFIDHNEVGDSPEAFGHTVDAFHQMMQARQEQWPLSINATATHDTKRGEDVRARLNVLTDLAEEWLKTVREWQELNRDLKQKGAPDSNDEYFIYQSLVGAYPMPGEEEGNFGSRLEAYLEKALREAKRHSNWTTPNTEYETASKAFATALLDKSRPFWKSFQAFHKKVAEHGIVNSLAQVLLKCTCPGVPDVYQGCELWDLSFVDPDNRRPVDYELRRRWLDEVEGVDEEAEPALVQQLWTHRSNAHIKLWLVHTLLKLRQQQPELFSQGEYIPLKVEGTYKDHVLAFARQYRQSFFVVAVPLHTALLCKTQKKELLKVDWKDTRIMIPGDVKGEWEHLLNKMKSLNETGINVNDLFKKVPLALLKMRMVDNARGAGILLHLTSLPAPFGIGDMGPGARAFADFLYRSRQKYWQLLPLNPTEMGQGNSPYSATSSRAGNTLLISPELLVKDGGLLQAGDLHPYHLPPQGQAAYADAVRVKGEIFDKAYAAFKEGKGHILQPDFEQFCQREAAWLDDFALYMVLKKEQGGKPWYEWPDEYKLRQPEALEQLATQQAEELDKTKWLQFIFSRQWHQLKDYCNHRGIQLLGDLPFYVSYDSADVWAHRDIFALDEEGQRTGMAGVPPDAFSDDGQLWGMPVFRWEVLKERGYDWWIDRLRKNQELFDLVRLDHFRAFADYWEVPAGETTARNGEWKMGPGADFFLAVEKALGELPFVAEDLGEITPPVLHLRDQFRLPGMKILQFAFGGDMPRSDYIPHNYTQNFLVYTGTHDNNTIRGWFNRDADEATRLRLEKYVGRPLSAAEIHLELGRMAYASVARIAILPLQDVLALDESARMNTPASGENNWGWRLMPGQITHGDEERLRQWTMMYNRE